MRDEGSLAALVLATPLSKTYLATIRDQITAQYTAAKDAGLFTAEQVTAALEELNQIVAELQEKGELTTPIQNPVFQQLFGQARSTTSSWHRQAATILL